MKHFYRVVSILFVSLGLAAVVGNRGQEVVAAPAERNLTVTLNPLITGVTVVDQLTGTITICEVYLVNTVKCMKAGSMTPTTNPPPAPTGLTVLHGHVNNPGQFNPPWQVWIVNNQTGDLMMCSTSDATTTQVFNATCKDVGVIAP
jgi:hypothetical protein